MALNPGLPAPLPKWTRVLIRLGEAALWALVASLQDEDTEATDVNALEWRRLVLTWTRATPAGTLEDEASCSWDLVNITGGQVDTSWTTADYTTCETAFDEWATTVRTIQHSSHTWSGLHWYRMRFRPVMDLTHRFQDTGPPQRVQTRSLAGTATGSALPYQVALSCTERTGAPKHWGRFYLPGLGTNQLDPTAGRIHSATTQTLANATAELYDDLQTAEFYPVVPVTQVNKVLRGGLLTVSSVQVDDIPDVIRRRRGKQAKVRTIGAATA